MTAYDRRDSELAVDGALQPLREWLLAQARIHFDTVGEEDWNGTSSAEVKSLILDLAERDLDTLRMILVEG